MSIGTEKRETSGAVLARDMRLTLIALWLGAAVFFSFAVAPSAFAVLPARELAGAVVGRTLAVVNIGGFVISLLLLLTVPFAGSLVSRRALLLESVALTIIAVVTAAGQWIITPRLESLRAQMGRPIDALATDDPLRVAFGSLHGYSVVALSVGMIAALIALLLIARRAGQRTSPASRSFAAMILIAALPGAIPAQNTGSTQPVSAPAITSERTNAEHASSTVESRQETFDAVWRTVNETHYDPTFGGVDWNKVRAEYAPRIVAARSDEDFYGELRRMLNELRLSHFAIYPPGALDPAPNGGAANGHTGIDLRFIDGQAVVTRVPSESAAAARAGELRPGFVIKKIDDVDVAQILARFDKAAMPPARNAVYAMAAVLKRLGGPVGSRVRVTYLDAEDREREALIERAAQASEMSPPFGNFPAMPIEFETRRLRSNVGYVRFNTFLIPLMERIRGAVREMGDATGLIFDLRGNPGGFGMMAPGIAALLNTKQVSLGTMRMRSGHVNFVAYPQSAPYTGPVVVIIDGLSLSTSEIFAGGMQETGRAKVVGERSGGAALPSVIKKLPNGALLQHAIADFTTPAGHAVEGRGVTPDIEVKLDRRALLAGRDVQLEAAIDYILRTPTKAVR